MSRFLVPLFGFLLGVFSTAGDTTCAAAATADLTGTGSAMEGDTVSVKGTLVHLRGIDAPDPGQMCRTLRGVEFDCFAASRDQLQSMLDLGPVTCTSNELDRSRQRVGVCKVLGKDLAAAMLVRGWAFAFSHLSHDYLGLEARAQSRRVGLWGVRAEAPWLWRTRKLNE
ncbi:thermonuclease family protein [Skermanella stibiiresistens]|nr:thermonuclease family protein [Skermanella stibiiresistens]